MRRGQSRGYPWVCAHRGLSHACPENTLPAFGAALALGVDEVEMDLWLTTDGVAAVCHDATVSRTTDGTGRLTEMAWADVRKLDASGERDPKSPRGPGLWRNVRVPRMEEVMDVVGERAGMNIHIKDPGPGGRLVHLVCDAIRTRKLLGSAYIAGVEDVLAAARDCAPEVARCCLAGPLAPEEQVVTAARFGCRRLQFGRKVTDAALKAALEAGLVRNLFWSDKVADARDYVRRGIDVVLTNRANELDGLRRGEAASG